MILNNAPQAEAVLSNVGEIGEFRIRNSAKAFNILSSGLYANKIRAIIRELSCNAVDSHTAAGNSDTPFEVHLPTSLEPYFSVRDFGTGLNHDQVTQIYTTYFESTKTTSNEFIGALGLGSKSPFSYTDNFTVTAIQNGVERVYSAFINGEGIPSIVKMGEQETDAPNGVEIKFSVNERYDFNKFYEEARSVYRFFKFRPVITGQTDFKFTDVEYETKNIIPGVHHMQDKTQSFALMGNIAYPIDMPKADESNKELRALLNCGLLIEFGIGELDFQASREGLSYIPLTIDSINKKLEALNAQLTIHLTKEADAIENKWDRSQFLCQRKRMSLWSAAVLDYVATTKFELFDGNSYYSSSIHREFNTTDLAAYNIMMRNFGITRHAKGCTTGKLRGGYKKNPNDPNGVQVRYEYYDYAVNKHTKFVVNDTKTGATERAKHHWRNLENRHHEENVFVLEPINRDVAMDTVAFFNSIHNPPQEQIFKASELKEKPRATHAGMGKNVTILQLEKRGGPSHYQKSNDFVWRAAGKLNQFDATQTYYYIELSGFIPKWKNIPSYTTVHDLASVMKNTGIKELAVPIYGIRKTDIEVIKKQANWVNLEDYLNTTLVNLDESMWRAVARKQLDNTGIFDYNLETVVANIADEKSPAKEILSQFINLPNVKGEHFIRRIFEMTKVEMKVDHKTIAADMTKSLSELRKQYPLVEQFRSNSDGEMIASYINLIDEKKGV